MKLKSFRIKNYKSVSDTNEVLLSPRDKVTVFAGQNESGKSSILEALNDYEQDKFNVDSKPFSIKSEAAQSVSCSYAIEEDDNFVDSLIECLLEELVPKPEEGVEYFDKKKLSGIKEFSLTREQINGKPILSLNAGVLDIAKASVNEKEVVTLETTAEGAATTVEKKSKIKLIVITEKEEAAIAQAFWRQTPTIVLFNDFCDLLPDKITIADLKKKSPTAEGYQAVKNLEKIIGVDFLELFAKEDLEREALQDEHNEQLSVKFKGAWKQRIHNDNEIKVQYNFEKRNTDEESYLNFYIETKDRHKIKPRLRSKGLVWFLSFWMELRAKDSNSHKLIILADEPGLHLHIRAQKDVLSLFEELSKGGHHILYTTHSPHLIQSDHLNRISLVLNDPKEGTTIESVTTSKIDSDNKRDALQPIANAIGLEVGDFTALGKKNVILEGISDFYYFHAMRTLLKRKDGYEFLPGIGVRKIECLISLCVGYGMEWVAIIDDDPTKGGLDSKNKFEEIRDHVFDGDEDKTKERMYILSGITGVENMFTHEDLKLINDKIANKKDLVSAVGNGRKVLFAKVFFEKVKAGEITAAKLSAEAKGNFGKAFDFIERTVK